MNRSWISFLSATAGQLSLDISMDVAAHDGVATTRFTRDVLCASLPLLRPLVLVLKQLLGSSGLSCGFRGGLSSYALVLMATSTLQQPSSLGGEWHGVGPLLQRFLQSFSQPPGPDTRVAVLLDMSDDGGSRLQTKLVPRATIGGEALLVQDPLDGDNNVGSSCFAFHHVQGVFRGALARLEASLSVPAAEGQQDLLGRLLDTRAPAPEAQGLAPPPSLRDS